MGNGLNITPRVTPPPVNPVVSNATIPVSAPDPDGAAAAGGIVSPGITLGPLADGLAARARDNFSQGNIVSGLGNTVAIAPAAALTGVGGLLLGAKYGADHLGQGIANFARGLVGAAPVDTISGSPAAAPSAGQGQGLAGQAAIDYFNSPAAAAARAAIPAAAVIPGNSLQAGVISRGIQPYAPLSTTAPAAVATGGGLPSPNAKPGTAAYHGNVISLATGQHVDPATLADASGPTTNDGGLRSGTPGTYNMSQIPSALAILEANRKDVAGRQLDYINQQDLINASARRQNETDAQFEARKATARADYKTNLGIRAGTVNSQILAGGLPQAEAK